MDRRSEKNLRWFTQNQGACKSRFLFAKAFVGAEGVGLVATSTGGFLNLQKRQSVMAESRQSLAFRGSEHLSL